MVGSVPSVPLVPACIARWPASVTYVSLRPRCAEWTRTRHPFPIAWGMSVTTIRHQAALRIGVSQSWRAMRNLRRILSALAISGKRCPLSQRRRTLGSTWRRAATSARLKPRRAISSRSRCAATEKTGPWMCSVMGVNHADEWPRGQVAHAIDRKSVVLSQPSGVLVRNQSPALTRERAAAVAHGRPVHGVAKARLRGGIDEGRVALRVG